MTPADAAARDELLQMVNGFELSRAVQVAATLGIADLLIDGPRPVSDLAHLVGAHPASLYRVLRALASVGVFAEDAHGRFGLTPRADYLRSDRPESLRHWATATGGSSFWSSWGDLLTSVRTGESAFARVHGISNWQYRAQVPEEGAAFDAAMAASSRAVAADIVSSYDFSRYRLVADIGGGQGVLIAAILAANPTVCGLLFDQAHVVQHRGATLEAAGVADRCQVVGGDFREAVPPDADAYVLKSIIHDWDDREAVAILSTCRAALAPLAKLLLVEAVLRPRNEADPVKFFDLRMLVMNGGRERTAKEFADLCSAAGLRVTRIVPTPSRFSVIEAVPTVGGRRGGG